MFITLLWAPSIFAWMFTKAYCLKVISFYSFWNVTRANLHIWSKAHEYSLYNFRVWIQTRFQYVDRRRLLPWWQIKQQQQYYLRMNILTYVLLLWVNHYDCLKRWILCEIDIITKYYFYFLSRLHVIDTKRLEEIFSYACHKRSTIMDGNSV